VKKSKKLGFPVGILVFAFALLIALTFSYSAYAAEESLIVTSGETTTASTPPILSPQSHDGVVFENGSPLINQGTVFDSFLIANDFALTEDLVITDAHFIMAFDLQTGILDVPFPYFIMTNIGNGPGDVISSGTGINVGQSEIPCNFPICFEVSFDFEEPVPLSAGVVYWFALKAGADFNPLPTGAAYANAVGDVGQTGFSSASFPPTTFGPVGAANWFQLTGHVPIVGGELIPIDSTALLLAGAQMNAAWMIPILVSAAGIGLLMQAQKTKLKHNSCPSCKLDSDDIFTLGDKTVGNCNNPKCRVCIFYKK